MDTQGFKTVQSKSQRRKQRVAAARAAKEKKLAEERAEIDAQWQQAGYWGDDADHDESWVEPLPDLTLGDRIMEFIPYWLDGVVAALKGEEVPKTEIFFERIHAERDEWVKNPTGWGYIEPGPWGYDPSCGWHRSLEDTPVTNQWHADAANGGWGQADNSGWETGNNQGQGEWGVVDSGGWNAGYDEGGWGAADNNEWGIGDNPGRWGTGDGQGGWDIGDDQGGWGAEDGKQEPEETRHDDAKLHSDDTARARSDGLKPSGHAVNNSFVEQVARIQNASGRRKKKMKKFYAVSAVAPSFLASYVCFHQMPTDQKLKQIEETVKALRGMQ
jgi:hypothetical protein